MKYDVIIVGGGASGLCSAYQLAKKRPDFHILVIEKETVCGRKLSASGNGKCNLTNKAFSKERYHSQDVGFVDNWVKQHSYEELTAFFSELGVPSYEKNGYYYPCSNQAKQVTSVLYEKCRSNGVQFLLNTMVTSIKKASNDCYEVFLSDGKGYECDFLILCTGGKAAAKLGGSSSGYKLAKKLRHTVTKTHPVLCPIYVSDANVKLAKGVRLEGRVSLYIDSQMVIKESGQIQFNEDNLSGIVIMNLSGYMPFLNNSDKTDCLHIDCLPYMSWEQWKQYVKRQCGYFPNQTIECLLTGVFPVGFVRYLLKKLSLSPTEKCMDITEKNINRLVSACKKLCFTPIACEDFDKAQVTGGGVSVKEIESSSFMSRYHKRLYITGELLDVNGDCGGYNLTFAMLSGIQAADHIANKM